MEQEKLPVIIVSNLKKTVKAAKALNTSAEVVEVLNKKVHDLIVQASEKAVADGRKTLMARDFQP